MSINRRNVLQSILWLSPLLFLPRIATLRPLTRVDNPDEFESIAVKSALSQHKPMPNQELTTVVIEPQGNPRSAIIWMHGLGADAHDFEPIVPHLQIPPQLGLRFIFPNAPVRPVTVNGGMAMRAWYDILGMDIPRSEDAAGVRASAELITALIEEQKNQGIPAERIVLAGFSQGGAMALHTGLRYPQRLAGILALSCYIPLVNTLAEERHSANHGLPIFMAHGSFDPVIPIQYGRASKQHLTELGYSIESHEYPLGHEVNLEEIKAIGNWLKNVLS